LGKTLERGVNLRWNTDLRRFEAEFSQDFNGDLAAVKATGFKTDGAPAWVWYSYKAEPLLKLQQNRPASGLTITPEARVQYSSLQEVEQRNEVTKAKLAEHKKALKKTLKIAEQEGNAIKVPEKGYIDASDLPPTPLLAHKFAPPSPPKKTCLNCGDPVYFYEMQEPYPLCLWCEVNGWVI
jgi:hypothetical protein